jgi:hypothetical protein
MTFNIPHELGDEISGPEVGDEICVKIDGTVKKNADGKLVLDVEEATVRNYTQGDSEEDEEEDSSYSENPKPMGGDDKGGIVISIMKKRP